MATRPSDRHDSRRLSLIVLACLLLLGIGACGPVIVDPRTDGGDLYSYSFNEFGCVTDRHTFSTKWEMCEALNDSALNNDCASQSRARYFASSGCPGIFVDH